MLPMKKRAIVAETLHRSQIPDAQTPPGPLEGAAFVTGAAHVSQLPSEGAPEIAFAGRSNSGKSSAINALARRTRLAHASRTPGRTRQINCFRLRDGALVTDLPGYGYAAVPQALKRAWHDFLWQYVTARSTLIGLVLIVDARHGLKGLDLELLFAFVPSARPVLILATKIDKLNNADGRRAVADIAAALAQAFAERGSIEVVGFSATSRHGVDEANRVITRWLGSAP
jgi:GTP-binding protein